MSRVGWVLLSGLSACAAPQRPWLEPGLSPSRAEAVQGAYDKAWRVLSARTGRSPLAPALRVYSTREAFLNDLRAAGFREDDVAFFQRIGGAPRPMKGTLWVPPDMKVSSVCHELTHSFIEALSGDAYLHAKWLDEGFATWFEVTECGGKVFDIAEPVPIAEMTTGEQWRALHERDAKRVYTSATSAVTRLVARFGEARVLQLLGALKDAPLEQALGATLSIDLKQAQAIADGDARGAVWVDPGPAEGGELARVQSLDRFRGKAWSWLETLWGHPLHPPQLRIYQTRTAFLADLEAAGFSKDALGFFARSGAPRAMPNLWVLWMPPDVRAEALCEQEAQAFFTALSGDASRRARWLDVGFARLVARRACGIGDEVQALSQMAPLRDMATEQQYRDLRSKSGPWAEASACGAVDRLVQRFGEKKVLELVAALRDSELEPALQRTLRLDLAGVQAAVAP